MQRGDYGPVRIMRGRYKNRTGYYDDDEGALAVVYLGEMTEPYVMVRLSSLEPVQAHLGVEAFAAKHPKVAAQLGVVVRR